MSPELVFTTLVPVLTCAAGARAAWPRDHSNQGDRQAARRQLATRPEVEGDGLRRARVRDGGLCDAKLDADSAARRGGGGVGRAS